MDQESWEKDWFNEDYMRLYADRGVSEAKQHVDFIIKELSLKGHETILDVGCGFGRHVIQLALKGFVVTGIDSSPVMIKKARQKAHQIDLPETIFIEGDIRDQNLSRFDVCLSLFTSFGYSDDEGNKKMLTAIHDHLNPGGYFFLDYLNPDYIQSHIVPYEEKLIGSDIVKIQRKIVGNIIHKTICFPQKTYEEKVKLYSHETLIHMIEKSGFTLKKTFGDFFGKPFSGMSERQIIIAEFS